MCFNQYSPSLEIPTAARRPPKADSPSGFAPAPPGASMRAMPASQTDPTEWLSMTVLVWPGVWHILVCPCVALLCYVAFMSDPSMRNGASKRVFSEAAACEHKRHLANERSVARTRMRCFLSTQPYATRAESAAGRVATPKGLAVTRGRRTAAALLAASRSVGRHGSRAILGS